jgi:hypothetical protein
MNELWEYKDKRIEELENVLKNEAIFWAEAKDASVKRDDMRL